MRAPPAPGCHHGWGRGRAVALFPPELMLAMDLRPGDPQFLNNRVILHNRFDYEDWPERERRRLMLRLVLTIPGWRKYPPHIPQTDVELGTRPA